MEVGLQRVAVILYGNDHNPGYVSRHFSSLCKCMNLQGSVAVGGGGRAEGGGHT